MKTLFASVIALAFVAACGKPLPVAVVTFAARAVGQRRMVQVFVCDLNIAHAEPVVFIDKRPLKHKRQFGALMPVISLWQGASRISHQKWCRQVVFDVLCHIIGSIHSVAQTVKRKSETGFDRAKRQTCF